MLTFKSFLTEMAKGEQGAKANSKGVAYETGLTAALNHNGKHPENHPDEAGMNAKEAHAHHMKSVEPEMQKKVKASISPSVNAIRDYMEKEHGIPKKNKLHLTWTAKKGQFAKTSKKEGDKENPGDMHAHDPKTGKSVGISAKFGGKPGLKSPGFEALHKLAGVKVDDEKQESNRKEIIKAGGKHIEGNTAEKRNESFRKAEKDPSKAKVVANINKKSQEHRAEIAGNLAAGFNKKSHKEHEHIVRTLLNADKHATPVVKIHHDPTTGKTHISDPTGEFDKIHKNTKKYRFEHKGAYIHIHATHKDGTEHHIASVGIKNNSSPFTHTVGSVSSSGGYKKMLDKSK
jgi:hypothetical protein